MRRMINYAGAVILTGVLTAGSVLGQTGTVYGAQTKGQLAMTADSQAKAEKESEAVKEGRQRVFAASRATAGNGYTTSLRMKKTTSITTYGGYQYFKYKAPAAGTINISSKSGVYAVICNQKKKALSDPTGTFLYSSIKKVSFGVKKGSTYYIRFAESSNAAVYSFASNYQFYASFTKVKDYNKSKKHAKKLKLNKTYSGLVTASDSSKKADWYKVKFTKTKKRYVTYKGYNVSGIIKFTMYNSKKYSVYNTVSGYGQTVKMRPYTIGLGSKLKKGTYYFKVTKLASSKGNGKYTIKVK